MPFATSCTDEQKRTVSVNPLTASGKPAPIDGSITVTVQSGDGLAELVAGAPTTFKAVSGSALADTVYLVEADADLGAGVVTISDTVTLSVVSASAVNFGFTEGAVEPK